jgi:uncharacterized membrane protein YcaP (DUF421 family)
MKFFETVSTVLGLQTEPRDLTFFQVALRGVIVFVASVIIMRLANRRFLSRMTSLDAVLGMILASMLARAVNGSAAFFPTLGGGLVLILLHRIFAALGFYSRLFETLVKGESDTLVIDGQRNNDSLRKNRITEKDLREELRLNGQTSEIPDVQIATLERSGEISVVNKD